MASASAVASLGVVVGVEVSRLVIISPHLDDAAFSCGSLLAAASITVQTIVVNVHGGDGVRHREDRFACRILKTSPVYLDLADGTPASEIRAQLVSLPEVGDVWIGPFGIRHPEHIEVAKACEGLVDYVYEELPYRVLWSEHMPHDVAAPFLEVPVSAVKLDAIRCYVSQLGGGPPGEALWASERYHARVRP